MNANKERYDDMSPYNRKNRVTDIERPIASNILGRDVLGINANVPAISKTDINIQDDDQSIEYTTKIK